MACSIGRWSSATPRSGPDCVGVGGRADARSAGAGGQAGADHRGDRGHRPGDGAVLCRTRRHGAPAGPQYRQGRSRVGHDPRTRSPTLDVVTEVCDVSDLDVVRAWTADFASRVPALHGLVHNAGLMPKDRTDTAAGSRGAAGHPRPWAASDHRTPAATAAGGGRGLGGVRVLRRHVRLAVGASTIWSSRRGYNGVRAYARTKRMQVVLADSWARRLAGTDIRVESMHPGWVDTPGVAESLPRFRAVTRPLLRDVVDGADTAVWLVATRPSPSRGHFWHDRSPAADDVRLAAPRRPGQGAPLPGTGQPADRNIGSLVWPARLANIGLQPLQPRFQQRHPMRIARQRDDTARRTQPAEHRPSGALHLPGSGSPFSR